jgi:hypothetical protein
MQATEHYIHMYAKFGYLDVYGFVYINASNFDLQEFDTIQ